MSKASPQDLNKLLPQTQCKLCTYDGCLPYAEAISKGDAQHSLCQPGGLDVYKKIQTLMNADIDLEDVEIINGYDAHPHTVSINLDECIGCTKCLPACPVDAIIGSPKAMHYVIDDLCTGCNLCIPTCPVDCITVKSSNKLPEPNLLLSQYNKKQERKSNKSQQKKHKINKTINTISNNSNDIIAAALERAKQRRLQYE